MRLKACLVYDAMCEYVLDQCVFIVVHIGS